MNTPIPLSLIITLIAASSSIQCRAACSDGPGSIEPIPTLGGSSFWVSAMSRDGRLTGFGSQAGTPGASAFRYSASEVESLGTLGGFTSVGYGINSTGDVVGYSYLPDGSVAHAFLFRNSFMQDLGTLGGSESSAAGINEAGQIVGTSRITYDLADEAFIYSGGKMAGLGSLGGGSSWGTAINSAGMVAGDSYTEFWEYHAFLHDGHTMIDLGDLGGGFSSAWALSDNGVVVGESTSESGSTHAFIYAGGVMTDINPTDANSSRSIKVNDAGQVIGTLVNAEGEARGFIYQNGASVDLGTLGGNYTMPYGINNVGQVVGSSATSSQILHAFLFQGGVMIDLNNLLAPGSGWELASAEFIDDSGDIVGTGFYHGAYGWFKMSPGTQNSPPVASAGQDQVVECGSPVTLDASGSFDPDGSALAYEWSAGGTVFSTAVGWTGVFPFGNNSVLLKVTDACGSQSEASINVVVQDTTVPQIQNATVLPAEIGIPNRAMVPVTCSAQAADTCDSGPEIKIVSITCNEVVEPGQIEITGPLTASLCATRDPSGTGRIYTITLEASDAAGNKSTSQVTVTVPKSNAKGKNKPKL